MYQFYQRNFTKHKVMEDFERRWAAVEQVFEQRFGKRPDMEGKLYLIGINELGMLPPTAFTKEQKQDLMHIAVCTLLEKRGYYRFFSRDEEGWLHFEPIKPVETSGLVPQEQLLKECMIEYFEL
jgi:hypothetical protein